MWIFYAIRLPPCRWPVHLLAGSVAGLAEHCLMFPFDSVKTRLQSLCPCPETSCPTAMHSLMSMVKREGLLRSLKGVNAVVLGTIPAHAFYYTVYENSKAYLLNNPRVSNSMSYAISGALATVIHDAVMNPAEVVKQRMQMIFSPYGNSLECIRCIYIREGLRAFYRSYITQLTLNVPYQCTHFMIYEYMQNLLNPHHDYNPSSILFRRIAGGIAAAITTPLDCVKTVLNTQQTPASIPHIDCSHKASLQHITKGWLTELNHLLPSRYRWIFRGLQARIIFQVPSTALSWSAYELCKYMLSM
uniref:Mitochondrial solute carrier n=1 Tax=Onchocerca gibsoni TaxID=6284 RepID=Q94634_ONCGI|nr:mitochondrial solute carrier [Onchocerca gibsoni]